MSDANSGYCLIEYLNEFEAICEMTLVREAGPDGGLFDDKKLSVENLVTLSH
jgi:hypothetical protein